MSGIENISQDELMVFLKLVCRTLQTDYISQAHCKQAVIRLLKSTDELALKVSGERIVRQKSLLESIVNVK